MFRHLSNSNEPITSIQQACNQIIDLKITRITLYQIEISRLKISIREKQREK